ncbi:MAG TPA: hypothetical protein VL651_01360 [Bacteroidia bacterium]|nr:hypothetical protein [Bacteroidia bacterium]
MRLLLSLSLSALMIGSAFAQDQSGSQISLTSFNAIARGKQVLLSWDPATVNATTYSLEKSKNGSEFTDFGNVQGSSVNTQLMETDFQPYQGLSYYRLKITAADGTVSYSNIVPVKYDENMTPVSPVEVDENAQASNDKSLLVVVLDAAGDQYYSKVEVANQGNPLECTDPDPVLTSGTYTIVGCSDQVYYARQMLVK